METICLWEKIMFGSLYLLFLPCLLVLLVVSVPLAAIHPIQGINSSKKILILRQIATGASKLFAMATDWQDFGIDEALAYFHFIWRKRVFFVFSVSKLEYYYNIPAKINCNASAWLDVDFFHISSNTNTLM